MKKLAICAVGSTKSMKLDPGKKFEVMINPEHYEIVSQIRYTTPKAAGSPGSEAKFSKYEDKKFTIPEFVLDGTGAIPEGAPSSVDEKIDALFKVVYDYNGSEHQPSVVQVSWGSLVFFARLTCLKVNRTLFNAEGIPLRAKVVLEFIEYKSTNEISKEANQNSPDLTHHIVVKAGDTLPLLCHSIYNDCAYFAKVARVNNLTNIRFLAPGTLLKFPPLA